MGSFRYCFSKQDKREGGGGWCVLKYCNQSVLLGLRRRTSSSLICLLVLGTLSSSLRTMELAAESSLLRCPHWTHMATLCNLAMCLHLELVMIIMVREVMVLMVVWRCLSSSLFYWPLQSCWSLSTSTGREGEWLLSVSSVNWVILDTKGNVWRTMKYYNTIHSKHFYIVQTRPHLQSLLSNNLRIS